MLVYIICIYLFIYIYISGTLPKGPTCFLGTYLRSRLLRRRWPIWTKRLPHAARRLRRSASNVPVFLVVWGGNHNKSHQQCVFVVLSKADHSILVQEKSSCDNRLSMYGNIGGCRTGRIQRRSSDIGDISYWTMYMCILRYHVYWWYVRLEVSSSICENQHAHQTHQNLYFLERSFGKNTQCMEVSSKNRMITIL